MDKHKQHDQEQGLEKEAQSQQEGQAKQQEGSDPLETLVSVVSALLLLGAIGFLIWEGISLTEPPRFEAETGVMWTSDGRYYLPMEVYNSGGESVQNLGLSVTLKDGEKTVARTETAIAWLPAHSQRRAVVIFDQNPEAYRVVTSFKGYEPP
jgi:uncharacterized protein (TIGR02588 family)